MVETTGMVPMGSGVPPEPAGPPRPGGRPRGGGRRRAVRVLAALSVPALVGAGAALAVARVTGWGSTTVESRTVVAGRIAERPADIPGILAAVLPAVVSITATSTVTNPFFGGTAGTATAGGTGIVVAADGQVVTNDHVVANATSITVRRNGSDADERAVLVGADPARDLALLRVPGARGWPVARLGHSSRVVVGADVVAIGYALGLAGGPTVTAGIVSATGRQVQTQTSDGAAVVLAGMLQTDAAISSGNSGGPLVDAAARVVGIDTVTATSGGGTTAANIGFAIPSDTVTALLPVLRRGG